MAAYEIIDAGEHNPYHFLFYMIANFIRVDISKDIVYYYPNKKNNKISEGFLALLPPNFTRHYEKDPAIQYTSFMNFIPNFKDFALPIVYKFVRILYAQHCAPAQIKGRKIYIQRKAPFPRSFTNESAVQNFLEAAGYETILLENHSVKEQIRIVSEAEFVVGGHGAGLAFLVFCHPDTKIIEITSNKNTETRHYYHMATAMGQRFFRFQDVEVDSQGNGLVNVESLGEMLPLWHHPELY